MGRRFVSEIFDCIWANDCVLIIPILLLWPMSAIFVQVKYQHCTIWSLMSCLKLCLAMAMMPSLMILATASLTLIVTCISMMKRPSLMTLFFIIHLLLMKFDWVNLSTMSTAENLKNPIALMKIMNKSSGLMRPLMTHLTHIQIWLSSLIMKVKLQTVHLKSLFQREKMMLLNLIMMFFQSMLQREHTQIIFLFNWMMLLLPVVLQMLIPTVLMNLILNIYANLGIPIWLSTQIWKSYF